MSTIKKVCPKPRVKPRTSILRQNDGPPINAKAKCLQEKLGAYKRSENRWKSTYSRPKSTFG
ncbi:S2-RNase [Pyrus ussuriensis x Pyrus communis]|uniref:S2-RNase n=1 Tax=Pyrus ussuriensis x Pyrus communis TaxID=2448454 RepID=A0A5N5FR46_9ROSA|nr:S2-RNase [Pyrus ussuriensis x Pyrus communis]